LIERPLLADSRRSRHIKPAGFSFALNIVFIHRVRRAVSRLRCFTDFVSITQRPRPSTPLAICLSRNDFYGIPSGLYQCHDPAQSVNCQASLATTNHRRWKQLPGQTEYDD
jgi:hypothetical protein